MMTAEYTRFGFHPLPCYVCKQWAGEELQPVSKAVQFYSLADAQQFLISQVREWEMRRTVNAAVDAPHRVKSPNHIITDGGLELMICVVSKLDATLRPLDSYP